MIHVIFSLLHLFDTLAALLWGWQCRFVGRSATTEIFPRLIGWTNVKLCTDIHDPQRVNES